MIALAAAIGAMLAAMLALVRLFAGPTLYDRALAAHSAAGKAALACAALGVMAGASQWIDVAIALVLGMFATNAAILKFFRARSFQAPMYRAPAKGERG